MCYVCIIHENMTHPTEQLEAAVAPSRKRLERMLELERLPWYSQGVHNQDGSIDPERAAHMDEHNRIQKELAAHYPSFKKGDRILLIGFVDRHRKVTRKDLFRTDRKPKALEIFEASVHSPVGYRIRRLMEADPSGELPARVQHSDGMTYPLIESRWSVDRSRVVEADGRPSECVKLYAVWVLGGKPNANERGYVRKGQRVELRAEGDRFFATAWVVETCSVEEYEAHASALHGLPLRVDPASIR